MLTYYNAYFDNQMQWEAFEKVLNQMGISGPDLGARLEYDTELLKNVEKAFAKTRMAANGWVYLAQHIKFDQVFRDTFNTYTEAFVKDLPENKIERQKALHTLRASVAEAQKVIFGVGEKMCEKSIVPQK